MSRFEPNLRIPGPTGLPPTVREAGGRQMVNHRGEEFKALLRRVSEGMKPFFGTSSDVIMLTCAGTGALEAAVVNTLSPGDPVLAVTIGAFGDRFAKIAEVYGASVTRLEVEWGRAAEAAEVGRLAGSIPGLRAVLLTHNETSTGVTNDIPALAAAVRAAAPEALILVDAISALGAVPFAMDEWGLDLVVTGSQKAWMSAPGMAMAAVGPRAWAAGESARMPRFYLDLKRHRDSAASGETPWTPAVAVMYQVDEGLRLMQAEGDGVFTRHAACQAMTRAGLRAIGFELLAADDVASKTVTAARVPDGVDWSAFNKALKARGLVVAGGQGKLKGHIFRRRPPRLGHDGRDPRGHRRARGGRHRAGPRRRAGRGGGGGPARAPRRTGGGGARVRILVVEPLAPEGLELLRAHHDVDEKLGLERSEIAAILPDYDALVVRSQVKVDAELIAAGTRLVVVGRAGVGVDNVDLEAATRAGITVVNAPTGNTIAAAEHTIALMYGLARKTAAADASMRRGEWKRAQFTGIELRGKTLGIVGLGKIGQAIAVRARAMEMTVIGSDPFVTPEQAANVGVELVTFDDLVERADVITVHVPMTRTTRGLINAAAIARMKPGVLLLNVARGGILDEADVAQALRDGRVAGAGIDVFEAEPPTGSPLLDAPNTLLTPHLGASTAEAQVAVAEEVAEQIIDVLDGRPARYAVNAPLLTPETAQAIAPYLPLAETLGRFLGQFAHTAPRTLTLEVAGEPAAYDASPLVAAVLRGLLETSTTERVNLVNAGTMAKARGIKVVERKTSAAGAFASLLTVTAEADGRSATVAGTVANGEPHIVRLDEHAMDLAPADSMLITRHRDKPGTMGRIGVLLGEADVNISAMTLARSAPRADAFMVLALDDQVPAAVAEAIRADDAVIDVWTIRLGGER